MIHILLKTEKHNAVFFLHISLAIPERPGGGPLSEATPAPLF
jgi:hypothetical protein